MQILARNLISNDFTQNAKPNCPVARTFNNTDIKQSLAALEPAFMDVQSFGTTPRRPFENTVTKNYD